MRLIFPFYDAEYLPVCKKSLFDLQRFFNINFILKLEINITITRRR